MNNFVYSSRSVEATLFLALAICKDQNETRGQMFLDY